jgi:6-phosphofructokinase 1
MRIGIFCSGGDAPGMNACTRAAVRAAVSQGHEVIGIRRGYQGLLEEDFYINAAGQPVMDARSVSGILGWGGTVLRTSRSPEFQTEAGQQKATAILRKHRIDALIAIGGDGTYRGAIALARSWNGQIIGCPGTIDNDLVGTDFTIGFHTAVNTAVEAVDKLRDTAESHERMFIVEVMGRHSGYIALFTALAAGAEIACLPETSTSPEQIIAQLHELRSRGKRSIIIVVAEGDELGGAVKLSERLDQLGCPFSSRVVILGHIQRGGSPSPNDRILAGRMGDFAVQSILAGKTGEAVSVVAGQMTLVPFSVAASGHHAVPTDYVRLLDVLAQ